MKKTKNRLLVSILGIAILGSGGFYGIKQILPNIFDYHKNSKQKIQKTIKKTKSSKKTKAFVLKVIDGDTIICKQKNKSFKVRLIGINAPESVHPNKTKNTLKGKIASKFTKSKLERKFVELEKDVQNKDKYNRYLRYVYIDEKMFNLTLIKKGYAVPMQIKPNTKYKNKFEKAYNERN